MFDIYFTFMKALHVYLLSRRHQFQSILASTAESRMVSPTKIMLALRLLRKNNYWTLSVMGSIFKTSCDEVWKNMSPGDGILSHSLEGMPILRLHDESSTFTNVFCSPLHQGDCSQILLASYY